MASIDSDVVSESITFDGVWLHDPEDTDVSVNLTYWQGSRQEGNEAVGEFMHFAGKTYPVADISENFNQAMSAGVVIPNSDKAQLETLRTMLNNRNIICYRDNRGRKIFGMILNVSFSDEMIGNTSNINIQRVEFSEEV